MKCLTTPVRPFRSGAILRNQLRQLLYSLTTSQEGLTVTAGQVPGVESQADRDTTRRLLGACMGRLKCLETLGMVLRKQIGKGP